MRPYGQSAARSRCHRSWRKARLQGRSDLVSGADATRRPDPELTICKFSGRSHQRSANSQARFARSFGNSPTRLASHRREFSQLLYSRCFFTDNEDSVKLGERDARARADRATVEQSARNSNGLS